MLIFGAVLPHRREKHGDQSTMGRAHISIRERRWLTLRALLGLAGLSICALGRGQPLLETGADAETTEDGLHRVATSLMDAAWVRPDLNLTPYDAVYIRHTGVSFRAVGGERNRAGQRIEREEFPVPDNLKVAMRGEFEQAFREEFSDVADFPASAVPGRNVVMAQGFLVDVTTTLPPDEAGTEFVQNLAWEVTIVLELRDSMSDDILARTVERERIQEIVDSDFVREQVHQLTQRWARLLHTRFDELVSIAQ